MSKENLIKGERSSNQQQEWIYPFLSLRADLHENCSEAIFVALVYLSFTEQTIYFPTHLYRSVFPTKSSIHLAWISMKFCLLPIVNAT